MITADEVYRKLQIRNAYISRCNRLMVRGLHESVIADLEDANDATVLARVETMTDAQIAELNDARWTL